MGDPRWENLRSGAMPHSGGEPEYDRYGDMSASEVARIVEAIEAAPKSLQDYYPEPWSEGTDPAVGKSWMGVPH